MLVDIGTGYYVEKSAAEAEAFYRGKVETLSKNLADLEKILAQKSQNVRIVEDGMYRLVFIFFSREEMLIGWWDAVLRQKVLGAGAQSAS